jgi:hypothetical protein
MFRVCLARRFWRGGGEGRRTRRREGEGIGGGRNRGALSQKSGQVIGMKIVHTRGIKDLGTERYSCPCTPAGHTSIGFRTFIHEKERQAEMARFTTPRDSCACMCVYGGRRRY